MSSGRLIVSTSDPIKSCNLNEVSNLISFGSKLPKDQRMRDAFAFRPLSLSLIRYNFV